MRRGTPNVLGVSLRDLAVGADRFPECKNGKRGANVLQLAR